ncbi:hypothetical protein Droror1_Dr00016081 [Drosera rotundifolia]
MPSIYHVSEAPSFSEYNISHQSNISETTISHTRTKQGPRIKHSSSIDMANSSPSNSPQRHSRTISSNPTKVLNELELSKNKAKDRNIINNRKPIRTKGSRIT